MRSIVCVFVVALVGCGSTAEGTGEQPAAATPPVDLGEVKVTYEGPVCVWKGAYEATASLKSGTGVCSQVGKSQIMTGDEFTQYDPMCVGTATYSADCTRVTEKYTCPLEDGARVESVIGYTWQAGGRFADGALEVTLRDGTGARVCSAIYSVFITQK